MNAPTNAVVVGVAPSGYDAALGFAAAEARRTQRPLHLIHVLQLPAGEAFGGEHGRMLEAAKATLDEAANQAQHLVHGKVPVTSELVENGWVVADLVERADTASVLVMQHRAMSKIKRAFAGSIVHSVAGRSHVPVISVPEGWEPTKSREGFVTAAVQDPVEAPLLLRAAFDEARARGARLVVLHAWWLASGYDVVVVDGEFREQWTERTQEELDPVLTPLRAEYADVKVAVQVRHAPAAEAVLDSTEDSELLVLGRRHHLLPLGSHLGPVARAALDHSTCPVLITPERVAETARTSAPADVPAAELAPAAG
jgi:nucleotide-binding universal stress UspA family protein